MQTITTKHHPATNHLGARMSATTSSGIRKYISYNNSSELSIHIWHIRALTHLVEEVGWTGRTWYGGGSKIGMVWVQEAKHLTVSL